MFLMGRDMIGFFFPFDDRVFMTHSLVFDGSFLLHYSFSTNNGGDDPRPVSGKKILTLRGIDCGILGYDPVGFSLP